MKHYTTADVAAALGVAASTVRAYNARGQMPAPSGHVGRTPYWVPEDVEPWIEARRPLNDLAGDGGAGSELGG